MYAHLERKLDGKIKLLEGRPAPGGLPLKEFFNVIADACQEADPTIPLDNASIKAAFESFRDRWYAELTPDITLDQISAAYEWPGYMSVLYECFYNWTYRTTALSIQFLKKFQLEPESVLVYADGFGAASCLVAAAFPNTKVICHVMGEKQLRIANSLQSLPGMEKMVVTQTAEPAEVLMAFETFEHFDNPLAVAGPFIDAASILIYTAPWKVRAHGHFTHYNGIPCEKYSRHFGKYLRSVGYIDSQKALGFHFFNSYPRIHIKQPATA